MNLSYEEWRQAGLIKYKQLLQCNNYFSFAVGLSKLMVKNSSLKLKRKKLQPLNKRNVRPRLKIVKNRRYRQISRMMYLIQLSRRLSTISFHCKRCQVNQLNLLVIRGQLCMEVLRKRVHKVIRIHSAVMMAKS